MQSQAFRVNPVGVDYVPEDIQKRMESGVSGFSNTECYGLAFL